MQVIEFMQAGSLSSQQKILTERKKIYFGNKLNAIKRHNNYVYLSNHLNVCL